MKKFVLVSKQNDESARIENKIHQVLIENGWQYEETHPELIICVGGDGTFLHAVHLYMNQLNTCSFLAIHTGTLGFFTDYTSDEVDICIADLIHKTPIYRKVPLLEVECDQERYYAVNEIRIENVIRTQMLDVLIDGELLETFRGTGMCVSTQSGSTAYNRSLKGAVIEEGLNLMQLQEITGIHHHKFKSLGVPYIMKPERVIEFQSNDFSDAILCYDQKHLSLDHVKKICVKMSDKMINFAKYREINYLNRIKDLY